MKGERDSRVRETMNEQRLRVALAGPKQYVVSKRLSVNVIEDPEPLLLNWRWFAGFFQADGCITMPAPKQSRVLSTSQANREPLDLMRQFLFETLHDVPITPVCGPYANDGSGIYVHNVCSGFLSVLTEMCPWLLGHLRDHAVSWLAILYRDVPAQQTIDDDWVAGFWEGDGSIYLSGNGIQVVFAQKDVAVLKEIQSHLANRFSLGTIYDYKYRMLVKDKYLGRSVARLTYHCGVRNLSLVEWLYRNVRCEFRRSQLRTFLKVFREDKE